MVSLKYTSVVAAAAALGALVLAPPAAHALVESISVPNAALSGFTGPYASVSITVAAGGGSAAVAFTSATTNGVQFRMGDGGSADLNVNGSYTLGAVTEGGTFDGLNHFLSNTPGQVDGFGNFNLSLNSTDGYPNSATSISFTITNTSGTPWTDATVLVNNASGANAAIHGFACTSPCTVAAGALATGFAANGGTPPPPVPEPASLALLASGLFGLAGLRRLRRRE